MEDGSNNLPGGKKTAEYFEPSAQSRKTEEKW